MLSFPSLSDPIRNPLVTFRTENDAVRMFADHFDLILVRGKGLIAQDAKDFHRFESPAFFRFQIGIYPFLSLIPVY